MGDLYLEGNLVKKMNLFMLLPTLDEDSSEFRVLNSVLVKKMQSDANESMFNVNVYLSNWEYSVYRSVVNKR